MKRVLFNWHAVAMAASCFLAVCWAIFGAGELPTERTNPFTAAEFGDLASLKALVEKDPSIITATNLIGATPLHSAALGNQPQVVNYLVGKGAEVNARDKGGYTPLHRAAMAGGFEAAKALIACGADPAAWTQTEHAGRVVTGSTVLDIAAMTGCVALVELLLEKGVPVQYKETQQFEGLPPVKQTPLHWACQGMGCVNRNDPRHAGNRRVIALLADKIGDINVRNLQLRSPLLVAAAYASPETAQYLLETYPEVDINLQDGDGNTALHLAVFTSGVNASVHRRAEVVRVLLKHGARLDLRNLKRQTPRQRARNADPQLLALFPVDAPPNRAPGIATLSYTPDKDSFLYGGEQVLLGHFSGRIVDDTRGAGSYTLQAMLDERDAQGQLVDGPNLDTDATTFKYRIRPAVGRHIAKFRLLEKDERSGKVLEGPWTSVEFTTKAPHNEAPKIDFTTLKHTPGAETAVICGEFRDYSRIGSRYAVQVDNDGDGLADTTVDAGGSDSYQFSQTIGVPASFRIVETDSYGRELSSEWIAVTRDGDAAVIKAFGETVIRQK